MADSSSALMPGDAVIALRSLPRRIAAALGVIDDSTESRAQQLGPEGVSAIEIILGATATLAVFEKGLADISTHDEPPLHPAVINAHLRSVQVTTAEPSGAVLEEFTDRVGSLADLASTIKGRDWSRTGTCEGRNVSALDLLREAVTIGVDALNRTERTIAALN